MEEQPNPGTTPPDTNSNRQRRRAFLKAAYRYGRMRRWRDTGDRRFVPQKLKQTAKDLLATAERLPANPRKENSTDRNTEAGEPKPPVVHLLGAGHGYRKNPCQESEDHLLEMTVSWHRSLRRGKGRDAETPDEAREDRNASGSTERSARVQGVIPKPHAGRPAPPRPTQT